MHKKCSPHAQFPKPQKRKTYQRWQWCLKYANSVGQEEGTAQKDLCGRGFCRHRASSANQKSRPPLIARSKNHEKSVWGFANFCFARDAKFPVVFSICSGRKVTRFPIHFSIVLSDFGSPPWRRHLRGLPCGPHGSRLPRRATTSKS